MIETAIAAIAFIAATILIKWVFIIWMFNKEENEECESPKNQ